MDSLQVTELEENEQAVEMELYSDVDDELVMAVSAPHSNKEWQE